MTCKPTQDLPTRRYPTVSTALFTQIFAAHPSFCNRLKELAVATVVVGVFGYSQAHALSLGEIQIKSHLGQPIDAVVQISAAPGEVLRADCFSIARPANSSLPAITNVRLSLSRQLSPGSLALQVRGTSTLREPLSELIVQVNCPGVPQMTRTFLVMVDPPNFDTGSETTRYASTALPAPQTNSVAREPVAIAPPARVRDAAQRIKVSPIYGGPNDPIEPGSTYVVKPGDVLSMIASRVQGRRDHTILPISQNILDNNPHAFLDADPNHIDVGARLSIPLLTGGLVAAVQPVATTPARLSQSLSQTAPSPQPQPPINASPNNEAALRPTAVGLIQTPLKMVFSQRFSSISRERLIARREGKIEIAQPTVAPPAPDPRIPSQPSAPAIVTPTKVAATNSSSNDDTSRGAGWLWLLLGLVIGGLATLFGMRNWLKRQLNEKVQEQLKAERYQERLDVARRQRQNEIADSSIVVSEERAPERQAPPTPAAPTKPTMPAAMVSIDRKLNESVELTDDDDLDFDVFEEPGAMDLEMLARDYAQTSGDIRNLEGALDDALPLLDSEELGLVDTDDTSQVRNSLDLELPDETAVPQEDDVISHGVSNEELAKNAALLELDYNLTHGGEADSPDSSDDDETTQLAIEDDSTAAGRTGEDFYHLEASSIMDVSNLSFELDEDGADESKILEFRKRPGRTGTDDSSGGEK